LANSICFPILLFGIAAVSLTKKEINSFARAYNNVFAKLFKSFDVNIIRYCQFYCNILPFEFQYDLVRYNFLVKKDESESKSVLDKCDREVLNNLMVKYKLNIVDSPPRIKYKIWCYFENTLDFESYS
jgi:hypothetical protein